MESGDIPDANIQASTYYVNPAKNGRLSLDLCPWSAAGSVSNPWIQADIGYQTYVSGVITQGGCGLNPDWVTTLKISTFEVNTNDAEEFVTDDSGQVKASVLLNMLIGKLRLEPELSMYCGVSKLSILF